MNDISRRFSLWLSGYYEDFQTMRVISEGEDYAESSFFTNRRDSHAGNTMAAQAYNNSRFAFDYLTRSFASKAPLPLVGQQTESESASLHNEGPSQWLTHDPNRIGSTFYEGRATLTYPDTLADAASLRTGNYPRRADYSHFASGWGTQNTYWVRHGDSDATYGRASFTVDATHGDPFGATATRGYGKFDITALQPADTSGVPSARGSNPKSNYRKHKVMMNSSLCGVYLGETGEVAANSGGIGLPYAYLYPVKSPSGKPFFRHSISRRIGDWLTASRTNNGSGKNNYKITNTLFVNEGDLGSDDQWFALNKYLNSITATGLTYSAGATSITVPASLSPVTTRVLDPSEDRHLPDKTGANPTQVMFLDFTPLTYTSFSVSSGAITFQLSAPLASTHIQPHVKYYSWADQASDDNTITVYNLTTAGTPTPDPVFQFREDTSDNQGYPLICFRDGLTVLTTDARTTNGESGVQDSPTFNVSSNTTLGYTYYYMQVNLNAGHSGFVPDPTNNFASDPLFKLGNSYGRLEAGDYVSIYLQNAPEKVVTVNTDGSFDTDGVFSSNSSESFRISTVGSGNGGNTGRVVDGLHGFQPVIVGDTELNAQTDGERFTIRLANQSFDHLASQLPGEVRGSYQLSIGYNKTEAGFELNERGNMTGSKAAITHNFEPVGGSGLASARSTQFLMFKEGTTGKTTYTMDQLWYDLDIVVDFTNQQYFVFHDGTYVSTGAFNAKTDGSAWTASDFYGWSLGVTMPYGKSSGADEVNWNTIVTMIDRAGYIYAVSDRMTDSSLPSNIQQDDVIFSKFKIKSMVDGITQGEFVLDDDSDLINLPQLVSGRPNWKMLLFRDNDYRPIHSSIVTAVNFKQSAKKKTKEIILKTQDSIGELDFQFPYFDIGQENGAPSLVAHYRRYEVTNYADIFHFGTTSLLNLNPVLGFDENSKASNGEYLPRYDQRMRLYSGHPIQLYGNENTNGPNYTEDSWEVSRLIDHFEPDANDATKTRVVFKSDFIKYADDMIAAGVQVAIKGMWRAKGIASGIGSDPATPKTGELGLITAPSNGIPTATPHNEMRGLWTVEQAQTVLTGDVISSANLLHVADTSLFPASGTVKIGGTGATQYGAVTKSYSSKTSTTLALTTTVGEAFGAGTVVKETTATDYIVIDKEWTRSLVVESISDNGGFLQINFVPTPDFPYSDYEWMGGTGYANPDSTFAKNDLMTPTVAPNNELIRVYVKPNAAGIAHDSAMADLPSQVYTSTQILANSAGQGNILTTTPITSLSSSLQAALPISLGAGAGGLADGLEADLAYMSFPKKRGKSWSVQNVGNSYAYRNIHTRWIRDLPQSLWFQKTYGVISEYPYGATSWRGAGFALAAHADLQANFNSGTDTSILIDNWQNFPYAGVCEIWTNDPNPFRTNSEQAIMLTSFTYEGKNFTAGTIGTLTNVKFADPNKGIIATTGGAGNRVVICRNIDGDYKHIFALFADMRNDGSADADGGTRKEDFGLLHPIQQNYKLKVVWADTGKDFVDLKIGADADIWQLSAKNDPSTGTAWSDNPSAIMTDYNNPPRLIGERSDQTELLTHYHNWEDKAGAFVIVDLSKFFNLNTEANLGRIGQSAGGMKQLGEYLVEGQGEPTLIDNYHYQAAATFQNADSPIIQHINSYRWADAKTVLTQDIVSASPITTNTAAISPSDTEITVQDNSVFPASGTGLLVNADTFDYTGKGGVLLDARPANLGHDITGNGTFTTSGGGATVNATGSYNAEFELTATTGGTFTPGSGWGNFVTYNWIAMQGKASGTITSGYGGLNNATVTIVRNDFYTSPPQIQIQNIPAGATGGFDITNSLVLATNGRLKFDESFTITNPGKGFTSQPGFIFSTGTSATGVGTFSNTLLTGVTGISSNHAPGSTITFGSTITYLDVEDTTFFPAKLGVNAFAGQNTAGLIEAKTTDAQGNEFEMKYVFSYTSKTSTRLNGIKYRPVKQGETVDTAAAGLWAADTFTVTGVPSIKAEGSVIRASIGSSFPMGFMLKLEGRVKTPGIGNYYEHDKIRVYQQSALFDDWFKQMTLPALSDINNVPIMRDYNVDGNTSGAGSVESFGSVTQAQNKSIFQTLRTMAQGAGVGDNGSLITLNFQMGRDNRMEFRPTYNSGLSLDRNNLKVSDLKTSKAKSFSHVRVLYNGGDSFVTFPALSYKDNVRFKFVSAISVTSYAQALEIAKQEYQKKKDPAFKVEAEVIRESNETQRVGPMLENARFGYIADPAVQLMGRNGGYWTAGRGGLHFTGQNNALHGNIHGYGLLSLLEYQSTATMGIGIGGYDGAANYTDTYGGGLAHYPTNDLYNTFPWTQMYYWYGAKSVSYAVQIVHIPKGMPKVSETTGEELRVFISDAVATIPNTDREDNLTAGKKFSIHFADYDFDENQVLNHCPKLQATQHGIETITTLGSGYFEVPIPASYWSAGNAAGYKMVVSVNAEYLAAVARHKTADKFGGNAATGQTGLLLAGGQTAPTFSNANEFSIFPLGIREYPELGSSAVERSPYYAPRIQITDDINFIPGTFAQYEDSYIDINETMFISRVEYEYSLKTLDRVKLTLEREIGRLPEGLEGYLATNPLEDTGASGGGVGGGGGGQNTPPAGGGTSGRGGDGGLSNPVTPQSFPFGYTGGQVGTSFSNTSPPLIGGTDADLGSVQTPTFSGMDYLRLNNDTGIQQMGQEGAMITPSFSANSIDETTTNKFNGSMSLDNLLPNGVQGIPGQPRPAKIPQKTRAMEGIDAKFVSAEGEAAETNDGWILPGVATVGLSEAIDNVQHSLTLSATIPMDSAQPVLGLTAYVSAEVLDGEKYFELDTTITCEDTGESISHFTNQLVTQSTPLTHQKIELVPQQFFESAGVEGRRLKATIVRKPNQGSDDMQYSSVIIHGVHFENVVHNNQGTPATQNLEAFAGNDKDNNLDGVDLTSGSNPL